MKHTKRILGETALANSKINSVRDGLCEPDEEAAAQIYHLSLKARRCGIDAQDNPLRLMPVHLQKAERDAAKTSNASIQPSKLKSDKIVRLGALADQLSSLCATLLVQAKTRKMARELCILFRLGAEGMRIWKTAMKKSAKSPSTAMQSPRCSSPKRKRPINPATMKRPRPELISDTPQPKLAHSGTAIIADSRVTRTKSRLGVESNEDAPPEDDAEMTAACLLISCAVAMETGFEGKSNINVEEVNMGDNVEVEWVPMSRKRLCFRECGKVLQGTGKRRSNLHLPRGLTSTLNAPGA